MDVLLSVMDFLLLGVKSNLVVVVSYWLWSSQIMQDILLDMSIFMTEIVARRHLHYVGP